MDYDPEKENKQKRKFELSEKQLELIRKKQEAQNLEEKNRKDEHRKKITEKKQNLLKKIEEARKYEKEEFIPKHVSLEWLKKRKAQQEIPYFYYSFKDEDVTMMDLGIKGLHYDIKRVVRTKEKKRGKKITATDEYGDPVEFEPPKIKEDVIAVKEFDFVRMLKSGGRIFDPSKIVILEEEMPPNIREYIEIPKKEYEYPEDYDKEFKYGDKVIFDVNTSGISKGKIIEKKKRNCKIESNKKIYTVPLKSVITSPSEIGDEVEFKIVITSEVEGIILGFKDGKFIIGGLDGKQYKISYENASVKYTSKKEKYEKAMDIIPYAKDYYKKKVDNKIRSIVIQTLFDVFQKFIKDLEIQKFPNLYDFGFNNQDEIILRSGICGFDNQKVEFVDIDDEKYKGYWNYSFSFFPPNGEKEVFYEEKVYLAKDKDTPAPVCELYYDKEIKNWIYSAYKNKCIEKLTNDDGINEKTNQKFLDMSDPNTIIRYMLKYLGDDIFNLNILDLIERIKDKKSIIFENEYLFSILIVDVEKNLHKHTGNPDLRGKELAIVLTQTIMNFISLRFYIFKNETQYDKTQREEREKEIKKSIKENLINKKCYKYLLENPPEIDEEAKKFFDEKRLPLIKNEYYIKLINYINAKRKLEAAKKVYVEFLVKDKESREAVLKELLDDASLINKNFSNLTQKGLEVFAEIKRYEKNCFMSIVGKKTFEKYLKKVLNPLVYLKGEISKYTKFFQAKISNRKYKIDQLYDASIEYFFPEFAMGIADLSISEKDMKDRFRDIENDLEDIVVSVIETYLAMEFLGVRTEIKRKRDVFNRWDKYVKDVIVKCVEQTNSGENIPLEDVIVCYDMKKNVFTCNTIKNVLENIKKHDESKEKGLVRTDFSTTYGEEFIEKMRKTYKKEIQELKNKKISVPSVETPQQVELLKVPVRKSTISSYKIVLLCSPSPSYEQFKEKGILALLKQAYPTILIKVVDSETKKDLFDQYVKKYNVKKYPSTILFKDKKKIGMIASIDINKIRDLVSKHITQPKFEIKKEIEFGEEELSPSSPEEYTISIPYNNLGEINLDEVVTSIKNKEISFPYSKLFMSKPETFVNHKTSAKFGKIILKGNQKQYRKGEGIIFYDSDYENLDVLTNYFTDETRVLGVLTKDQNKKNLIEGWLSNTETIVQKAYEYALDKKVPFDMKALREGIFLSGVKECTTFKISQAITIYNEFKPKIVFDPFAGWGDRALGAGFSSTVEYYIGTDPNSLLKKGYSEIKTFVKKNFNKEIIFEHVPVEDFDFSNIEKYTSSPKVDLIFSSPPYFDFEIYSNEQTQSIMRYTSEDEWTEWFHTQTKRMFEYLKLGGHLVYYLGLCNTLDIPKNLIGFMKNEVPESEYLGVIPTKEVSRNRILYFYVWKKIKPVTKKWK